MRSESSPPRDNSIEHANQVQLDKDDLRKALTAQVRSHTPSESLHDSMDVVRDLQEVLQQRLEVNQIIEDIIGHRVGEIAVLHAIARGHDHPRSIGRFLGQVDAAVEATCEVLERKKLVGRHAHAKAGPADSPNLVHVTASGRVVISQAQALQVRLTDVVVEGFNNDDVDTDVGSSR